MIVSRGLAESILIIGLVGQVATCRLLQPSSLSEAF